jgi:clostripain
MKKNISYLLIAVLSLLLSTHIGCIQDECEKNGYYGDGKCDQDCPKPDPDCVNPNAKYQWTYMVYMGADNNLSPAGLQDMNEMETVGSTSDLAIVVQAEFSSKYSEGVPTDTRRFLVMNDNDTDSANLAAGTSIGNADMGKPETLKAFIQWAVQNYPAQHYALVIWDHGAGWKEGSGGISSKVYRGAVQDETSGSFMSLPELSGAVQQAGVHMDVINFDACLMAMYEVAYDFGGLADYMVFSEETEPGAGDPYDTILGDLKNNPSMPAQTLALTIVEKYDASYVNDDREKTTKSAVDMSKIDALHIKIKELATALSADPAAMVTVQAAQGNTRAYAYESNHDLYDFCRYLNQKLTGTAQTIAGEIMTLVDDMVIANKTNPDADEANNHGLAIYIPMADQTNSEDLAQYALLACNQTKVSGSGTWGAYVEQLITGQGGGTVDYGSGGFGLYLYWTDDSGLLCDADLDLYVWEPAADYAVSGSGQWHAPYMGQTTPNGFFSEDSYTSGTPEEYYLANDQVYQGDYYFLVNYWLDGQCTSAVAHLFIFYPGAPDWMELTTQNTGIDMQWPSPQVMSLDNPYPQGACNELLCLNTYTDWWVPDAYFSAKAKGAIEIAQRQSRPLGGKRDMMIFRHRMEIPSPAQHNQ